MMPYYFFRLGFLGYRDSRGVTETHAFPYVMSECDGFGWPMARHFDVIVGMDVLRQCRFVVDHERWSIAF